MATSKTNKPRIPSHPTSKNKKIASRTQGKIRPPRIKEAKPSQQNHKSFYTLFHASPVPTMLTRQSDNVILNVNMAFLEYVNLNRNDIIGRAVQDCTLFSKGTDKWLQGEDVRNYEQVIVFPDGEKKTMLTSSRRIQVENADAVLSTFIDITDRVRVEQQMRNLNIERASAELNERRRIAQLLHDDLQQRIFAIKMHLERLQDGFATHDAEAAKEDFAKLEAWLSEAIQMTRKLSSDINPLGISGSTLPEVILWLAAEMQEQYELETKFEGNGLQPKLSSNMLTILLQAMRELLFNVIKHAGTQEAVIRLEKDNRHSLRIIVSDNGKGFDMKKIRHIERASGLTNVRQQLSIFGCTLDLDSDPGHGTRATIGVPLRNSGVKP